ncbi:MAG: hypothetical protein AAF941_03505 [Pseudomonadota bacterium]
MHTESASPALFRIEQVAPSDDCVDARLVPATERASEAFVGRICSEGSKKMLAVGSDGSGLIGLSWRGDSSEPIILPVTVGMAVESSGEEPEAYLYFVEPRPSLVRVRKSDGELNALLQGRERDAGGVILALEDGTFATDALPISAEEAERLLGFSE